MTDKIDQTPAGRSNGARVVFDRGQRSALLVAFLLLVALRLPKAWVHGRFLDEEATVFLAYAWHHPALEALFRPFAGYWNLGASASTVLVAQLVKAGILPLERAPYLTMLAALAVQMLPAILLLTGRATWLANRAAIVVALMILSIGPGIEEVFLNVLHIQFHLALCAALILSLEIPGHRYARIGYALLLFAAPLCGPAVLAFLPLFALRALVDRDRMRWAQFAVFAMGGAIQLLLFYGASPLRGHMLDPRTIAAAMATRLIVMPTLGFGKADQMGLAIVRAQEAGSYGWLWAAVGAIAFFGGLLILALRRRDAAIWLLLSSGAIAVASFGFGMIVIDRAAPFDLDSERYTFLPLMLLCFALIAMATRGEQLWPLYASFLLLTLITGVSRYTRPLPNLRDGPSWPVEVGAWKQDHHHPLAVWPRPWTADLSDQNSPCPPVTTDRAQSTAPRYCESGWVAGFYRPRKAP